MLNIGNGRKCCFGDKTTLQRSMAGFLCIRLQLCFFPNVESTIFSRDQEGRVLLGVFVPSSSGPGWLETLIFRKDQEMQVNFSFFSEKLKQI